MNGQPRAVFKVSPENGVVRHNAYIARHCPAVKTVIEIAVYNAVSGRVFDFQRIDVAYRQIVFLAADYYVKLNLCSFIGITATESILVTVVAVKR